MTTEHNASTRADQSILAAFGILSLESSGAAWSESLLAVASSIASTRIRHDRRNQAEDGEKLSA